MEFVRAGPVHLLCDGGEVPCCSPGRCAPRTLWGSCRRWRLAGLWGEVRKQWWWPTHLVQVQLLRTRPLHKLVTFQQPAGALPFRAGYITLAGTAAAADERRRVPDHAAHVALVLSHVGRRRVAGSSGGSAGGEGVGPGRGRLGGRIRHVV